MAVCGVLLSVQRCSLSCSQNTSFQLPAASFAHRAGKAGKGKIVLSNGSTEEVTKEKNYILQGTLRVPTRKIQSKGAWCAF